MSEAMRSIEDPLDPFNYDMDQDIQELLVKVCNEPIGARKVSAEITLRDDEASPVHALYRNYLFPEGARHATLRYELRQAKINEGGFVEEPAGPYIVLRALVPKLGTRDASAFHHPIPLIGLLRSRESASEHHEKLLSYIAGESSFLD